MQTEEKLIAPYVMDIRDGIDAYKTQSNITTPLGNWFQSKGTTVAFKGDFGIIIDQGWWEDEERTTADTQWLCRWLGWLERHHGHAVGDPRVTELRAKVKSGEYKLAPLTNLGLPIYGNTQAVDPEQLPQV
tara:strand:+ start:1069 stop:1461 length:393 start_codon:yes stop_codon:yes gene_type:complete